MNKQYIILELGMC